MVSPLNCTFFSETPRPIAELQSYMGVFENSSVGPSFGVVSVVILGKTGQKVQNGDEKRGQEILRPKMFTPFSRLKI